MDQSTIRHQNGGGCMIHCRRGKMLIPILGEVVLKLAGRWRDIMDERCYRIDP
jgi:hypothetical protein